jgi:hypothetical protein
MPSCFGGEKNMKSASLTYGAGPGSTITLTAETIRVRDAIIGKFSDKSLAELNSFIATALSAEKDDNKRLGILAARVYILRMRMQNISSFNRDPSQKAISELTPADMLKAPQTEGKNAGEDGESEIPEDMYEEWNELKVVESGEINGVRIPKGVTITVGIEDARRLIKTKKAVFAKSLSDETDEVSPPIAAPEQNASEQNASEQNASEQNTADQSEPAAKMEMPSLEKDENPATLDNVDTPNEAVADSTSNLGEPVLASNSDIEQAMAELAEGEELDLTATPQSDKDNH